MSLTHSKAVRRILPRWRRSNRASSGADFTSLRPKPQGKGDPSRELRLNIAAFAEVPSIGSAAELISVALLQNRNEEARSAADFLLEQQAHVPELLLNLARRVAGDNVPVARLEISLQRQVHETRRLLQIDPRNPVLWSDMARHYAAQGKREQARRSMSTALQLAPDHRWVLRTTARFLAHQNDPVAAHRLLATHPRTKSDPWLIAAELACAQTAERPPKFWKQACDMLRMGALHPRHLTELATAVAMIELEDGKRKQAKRLVERGLIDPTENTLAQVCWAQENRRLSDVLPMDKLVRSAGDAYEADCRLKILHGDLQAAMQAAQTWQCDEPFAARPCEEMAYIASLLDDHDTTLQMFDRVLRLDGVASKSLELNAIFATLSAGKLNLDRDADTLARMAEKLVSMGRESDSDAYHAMANLGLWHYRYGTLEMGRMLYRQSIQAAQKVNASAAAVAATFAAREEILKGSTLAVDALTEAKALMGKCQFKAGEFYLRKLEALLRRPQDAGEILSPASAPRFLAAYKAADKAQVVRVERTKDGYTLWLPKGRGE